MLAKACLDTTNDEHVRTSPTGIEADLLAYSIAATFQSGIALTMDSSIALEETVTIAAAVPQVNLHTCTCNNSSNGICSTRALHRPHGPSRTRTDRKCLSISTQSPRHFK